MDPGTTAGTPPQDTGMPDAVETDPAALNSAEDLDEDRLRVDPLEGGMDPPERWSGADRFGTTPREAREGADLEQRLAEEEPDEPAMQSAMQPETQPDQMIDADDRTDRSVQYRGGELESPDGDEQEPESVRRGQAADVAGGSVADAMRTPDPAR